MDVIAAISTGSSLSAIGIVRVSGEGCFAVCDKVFQPAKGGLFSAVRPREMILGRLLDREGKVLGWFLKNGENGDYMHNYLVQSLDLKNKERTT